MEVVSTCANLPFGLEEIGKDTFDLYIPDLSVEFCEEQLYRRIQNIAPRKYPDADYVYIHMPEFNFAENAVNVHIIAYRRKSSVQG